MPLPANYNGLNKIQSRRGRRIPDAKVIKQTWTDARTIDTDGYSVAHAGQSAAGTTSMTLGGANTVGGVGKADYPRNVVITVTHASAVVAMSGTITGTDVADNEITEDWSVTAGTTSKTYTGKKAFKTVTSITETIAATAAANTIIAGDGKVLGVEGMLSNAAILLEIAGGSVVTTGTPVAGTTTSTADRRGTYTPSATLDGSTDFTVYYLSDNPEYLD